MVFGEVAAGLLLLFVGGDVLVRGAVGLARRFGVSELFIGLTLVGFGTSVPELVTSVQAALRGSPGIAIGNVIGSNICNVLLVLGAAALIHPVSVRRVAFRRDGMVVMAATAACVGIALAGSVTRLIGVGLVACLLGYVVFSYRHERLIADRPARLPPSLVPAAEPPPPAPALLLAAVGLVLTVIGAELLVDGAIALARRAEISEAIVGLTVVAVGTSLPELATSVMAAVQRNSDVAFGNVIGSSIYNVFGILGVTAVVEPISVPVEIRGFDVWVLLATVTLLAILSLAGDRISRPQGAVFVAGYGAYIAYLAAVARA